MKQLVYKLFFLIFILFVNINSINAYDFEMDGIYYNIMSLEDLTCAVVGASDEATKNLYIKSPITYNGRQLKVTYIYYDAFKNNNVIRSLKIETENFFQIGISAFEKSTIETLEIKGDVNITLDTSSFAGSRIKSVVINGNVSIGAACFSNCSQLEDVRIDHFRKIEYSAFANSGLKEFKWPSNFKTIPANCFRGCNLDSFIIPEGVTKIDVAAFKEIKIRELIIPSTVVNIENAAFVSAEINKLLFEEGESTLNLKSSEWVTEEYPSYYYNHGLLYSSFSLCNVDILINKGRTFYIKDTFTSDNCAYHSPDPYGSFGIKYWFSEQNYPTDIEKSNIVVNQEIHYDKGIQYFCENHYVNQMHTVYNKKTTNSMPIIPFCKYSKEFNVIKLNTHIPPSFDYEPNFTNENYLHWNIYVPVGTKEVYLNAPVWEKFWNIIETDFEDQSGIGNVRYSSDLKNELERYDINGIPVTEEYTGLVIIRYSDGSTEKRYVK